MKRPPLQLSWRAEYGLLLIKLCKEADAASAALGRYIPHVVPSEREFRRLRNVLLRKGERLDDL